MFFYRLNIALLLAAAFGCAPNDLPRDEYCAEQAELRCDAEESCCFDAALRSVDRDACIQTVSAQCRAWIEGDAFEDGRVVYDAALARAAFDVDELDASRCGPPSPAPQFAVGQLDVGGDCSTTETDQSGALACRPGLGCDVPNGVCVALGTAPLGGSCDFYSDCTAGLFCAEGACVERLPDFSRCEAGWECLSGHCTDEVCGPAPFDPDHWYCVQGR